MQNRRIVPSALTWATSNSECVPYALIGFSELRAAARMCPQLPITKKPRPAFRRVDELEPAVWFGMNRTTHHQ